MKTPNPKYPPTLDLFTGEPAQPEEEPQAPNGVNFEIRVGRTDFSEALARLKKSAKTKVPFEIVLSFADDKLRVQGLGMVVELPARGQASAEVHLDGAPMFKLARVLPDQDPLPLSASHDRLQLGSVGFPCRLVPGQPPDPVLPVDPGLKDILALRHRLSPEELDRSGYRQALEEAEKKRDTLVSQAAAALEPLGVTGADIMALVEKRIRKAVPSCP